MGDAAAPRNVNSLLELLQLEQLDRDLFRAHNPRESFTAQLYGGQVAAQAVRAAASTVPDDRVPHSMHGYFLRRGEADHPTIVRVARDRDGRSFSARHVVALQRGEAIFTASVSFHVGEDGSDVPGTPMASEPTAPEGLPEKPHGSFSQMFELRAPRPGPLLERGWRNALRLWARTRESFPDDPVLHACGLVYLSDVSNGFSEMTTPGIPQGGPSLDHSLYFHRPVRIDDWLFLDLEPLTVAGGRGVYRGSVHDRSNRLVATIYQEQLLRAPLLSDIGAVLVGYREPMYPTRSSRSLSSS